MQSKIWLSFAAVLLACSAGFNPRSALAAEPDHRFPAAMRAGSPWTGRVLNDPKWSREASQGDYEHYYPKSARTAGLSGEVVVLCLTGADGILKDCAALGERPSGQGFGRASVMAMEQFSLAPGDWTEGDGVELHLHWELAGVRVEPLPHVEADGVPTWERKPTSDEMVRFYPPMAKSRGLEGQAVVRCKANASGFLVDCETVKENPAGYGFGAATARVAAERMKLRPKSRDGRPVDGGMITIPLTWRLY